MDPKTIDHQIHGMEIIVDQLESTLGNAHRALQELRNHKKTGLHPEDLWYYGGEIARVLEKINWNWKALQDTEEYFRVE